MLAQSGYSLGQTQMISPFNSDPTLPIVTRDVMIQDIRDALKAGNPVLLEAGWYAYDASTRSWVRHSGHYVTAFGYDYDFSWGENQIQVKVVNPETNYQPNRQGAIWDTVTIERISPQPGITYPADRPFILSGSGFGGATQRGFLGLMIALSPELR
jgi:hypothetical protein